jgi:hypothetical protein
VESRELIVKTMKVGVYQIGYEGGGETPDKLKGDWNRKAMANSAIKSFLMSRPKPKPKVKKAKVEKSNGAGQTRV